MAAGVLDDPDYYLRHFDLLCTGLFRYRELLTDHESALLDCAALLDTDARRLLVRLLCRRGQFFWISSLHYSDIHDPLKAINALCHHGFASSGAAVNLDQALALGLSLDKFFTKDALKQHALLAVLSSTTSTTSTTSATLLDESRLSKSLSKSALVNLVDEYSLWPAIWQQCADDVFYLSAATQFLTLKLLYFGNSWQDFSEFVVTELGHRRYESYQLDKTNRRFDSRAEIELVLSLAQMSEVFEQASTLNDDTVLSMVSQIGLIEKLYVSSLMTTESQGVPAGRHRLWKLKSVLGRECERRGFHQQALDLYEGIDMAPARERYARCLDALERPQEAFSAAMMLFNSPLCDDEYRVSLAMLPRLAKKAGHRWQKPSVFVPSTSRLELPLTERSKTADSALIKVEAHCCHHFSQLGYLAFHLENDFCCGLFGLALWDIIFSPVKGAFDHPFQTAPTDMYRSDFYQRRANVIDARLASLINGDLSRLDEHIQCKRGLANDWVNWSRWTDEVWQSVRPCLDGGFLANMLSHMLGSLKERRSGFTDLVLIKDKQLKFVEVKGPGDRLAAHQIDWLHWLTECGLNASVLYVDDIAAVQ